LRHPSKTNYVTKTGGDGGRVGERETQTLNVVLRVDAGARYLIQGKSLQRRTPKTIKDRVRDGAAEGGRVAEELGRRARA